MSEVLSSNQQFVECDTCRAKPGSPTLCAGCLHNRQLIELLTGRMTGRRHTLPSKERLQRLRTLAASSIVGDDLRWLLERYDQLVAVSTPIAEALRQVGDESDWRDGDETDRVYAWHEIEPLWKALTDASKKPGCLRPVCAEEPGYCRRCSPPETSAQYLLQDFFASRGNSLSTNGRKGAEDFALWMDERSALKTSAIQESLPAKAVNPTDCGVPIDKREHQPLTFTHWSKDPLIPYAGCGCRSCEDARKPAAESLMVTCHECDACKVFTPIAERTCRGCGRPMKTCEDALR